MKTILLISLFVLGACATHAPHSSRTPASDNQSVTFHSDGWALEYTIQCQDEDCKKVVVTEQGRGAGWPKIQSNPMSMNQFKAMVAGAQPERQDYFAEFNEMGGILEKDPNASNFEKVMKPVIWTLSGVVTLGLEATERSPLFDRAVNRVKKTIQSSNENLSSKRVLHDRIKLSLSDMQKVSQIFRQVLPKR